jgi:hypothetical protein
MGVYDQRRIPEIAGEVAVAILIDTYFVKLGRTNELLDILKNAAANRLSPLPGFVASNIYVSRDARKIVSHLEWSGDVNIAELPEIDSLRTLVGAQELIESDESMHYELCYSQSAPVDSSQTPTAVEVRASLRAGGNWRTAP